MIPYFPNGLGGKCIYQWLILIDHRLQSNFKKFIFTTGILLNIKSQEKNLFAEIEVNFDLVVAAEFAEPLSQPLPNINRDSNKYKAV